MNVRAEYADAVIETYTGRKFNLFNEDINDTSDISLADIAHAISMLCRYNGHTKRFYSVAEHSVLVSYLVPEEYAMDALMHDASEAYLSDVPSPFKAFIGNYKEIEYNVQARIANAYNFTAPDPAPVKNVDSGILWWEAQSLMKSKGDWWQPNIKEAFEEHVRPNLKKIPTVMTNERGEILGLDPATAERVFLARHREISRNR